MRALFSVFLLAALATSKPGAGAQLLLLDLQPAFAKPLTARVWRNRTETTPGLMLAGKRYRGFNCAIPSRIGFDLKRAFSSFRVKVAILGDSPTHDVTFRILGDGKVLAATPPLFTGQAPLPLEVSVENIFLLELVIEGRGRVRGAWVDGVLTGRAGGDLTGFRPFDAPFSPKAYPVKFRRRVNTAIDRGVDFMRSVQGVGTRSPGAFGGGRGRHELGVAALVTLALLKGGVKSDDPQIVKAFEFMKTQPLNHTYSVSCLLLALEAKYFPGGADEKNAFRDRPRLARKIISGEDRAWIKRAADWLVGQQGKGFRGAQQELYPVWRYPRGGYDLSNTQYALFGLSAANRCGIPTSGVWLPVLRFLIGVQEREGPAVEISRYERRKNYIFRRYESAKARGFGYTVKGKPTGSMTSAGIASLILCQQAVHRKAQFLSGYKAKTRVAIRDALAWIEEYYSVDENPFGSTGWWHYYLYNLERSAVLLDMRFIGTRDWYFEGANALMSTQGGTGAMGGTINTAFAILFLKRATVPAMTSALD